jgi:hypothetical protein
MSTVPGWLVPGAGVSAIASAVALSLALAPLVTQYTAPWRAAHDELGAAGLTTIMPVESVRERA